MIGPGQTALDDGQLCDTTAVLAANGPAGATNALPPGGGAINGVTTGGC